MSCAALLPLALSATLYATLPASGALTLVARARPPQFVSNFRLLVPVGPAEARARAHGSYDDLPAGELLVGDGPFSDIPSGEFSVDEAASYLRASRPDQCGDCITWRCWSDAFKLVVAAIETNGSSPMLPPGCGQGCSFACVQSEMFKLLSKYSHTDTRSGGEGGGYRDAAGGYGDAAGGYGDEGGEYSDGAGGYGAGGPVLGWLLAVTRDYDGRREWTVLNRDQADR